ncbi:transposase [Leptolinea tardivitalis]|nr:IS256 family transposase [Leptolinea tardivitalis]GAP21811.1 transposase [Leptolinea tardivitalis]
MTHQNHYNLPEDVTETLMQQGLGALPEMIKVMINTAMLEERTRYLQAEEYERTGERTGYANGYKPKTVKTRVGEITFAIPQVREGGFYPSALEKGLRSERALTMTLAEMYIMGVSTRKVKEITEQLSGIEISAEQVRRATAQPRNWIQCCRNGGKGRWEKLPTCIWTPDMKKYGKTVKSGMPRFWWPQGLPHGVNVRCWGYRFPERA